MCFCFPLLSNLGTSIFVEFIYIMGIYAVEGMYWLDVMEYLGYENGTSDMCCYMLLLATLCLMLETLNSTVH